MKQPIFASNSTNLSTTTTNFIPASGLGGGGATTDVGNRTFMIAAPGTLSLFYVNLSAAPGTLGSGKSYAFTVYKNGSSTSLTTTISETATANSDLVNTVSVVAGDRITIQYVPANTPTASRPNFGMQFEGTNSGECTMGNNGGTAVADRNNATNYAALWNSFMDNNATYDWSATLNTGNKSLVSCPGTITSFYVAVQTAAGAGKTWTFSIYKNGTQDASSIVTISGTSQTANHVSGLSISVAAGDDLAIAATSSGTPTAAGSMWWGTAYSPTTDGQSPLCYSIRNAGFSSGANNFLSVQGVGPWNSGEAVQQQIAPATVSISNMRFDTTAAPGVGKSITFTLRINGSPGTLTQALSGASTSGSDLTHSDQVTAGQLVSVLGAVSGTPSSGDMRFGFIATISGNVTVTPGVASLTLAAQTPSINSGVVPGVLALVLSPQTPGVGQSVVPGVASLAITALAPSLNQGYVPGVAALVLTALPPDLKGFVTPGTAALVLAPQAPGIGQSVVPGPVALVLTAQPPSVQGVHTQGGTPLFITRTLSHRLTVEESASEVLRLVLSESDRLTIVQSRSAAIMLTEEKSRSSSVREGGRANLRVRI